MLDLMLITFKGPLTFFFFLSKEIPTFQEAISTLKNLVQVPALLEANSAQLLHAVL